MNGPRLSHLTERAVVMVDDTAKVSVEIRGKFSAGPNNPRIVLDHHTLYASPNSWSCPGKTGRGARTSP
jgi:hypothetical protein